jgi:hypothetical protein
LLVCTLLAATTYLLLQGKGLLTQDFRAFYAAGQMLRHSPSLLYDLNAQQQWQQAATGEAPILPFFHPAYEALLYAPLSLLNYRTAYLVYACWNMLLLWLCYLVSPMGAPTFSYTRRPLLLFLSFPLLLCIFVGQNSLLLLLTLCIAEKSLSEARDFRGGLLLGLATFKLAIIIPLAFLLTIRKGYRFLAGFLLAAVPALALSVWLTGISGTRDFLHLLGNATLASHHSVESQRQAAVWLHAMPNLSGLLYLCGTGHLAAHSAFAVNMLAAALVLGAGAYLQRHATDESTAFSAAVVCAVLVSPHLYIYDFSALILPLLLLSSRWVKLAAAIWFVLPPILYAYGYLTWFSPAVVIPVLLLAICIAEFGRRAAPSKIALPALMV